MGRQSLNVLYNVRSVILPTEIQNAAAYLSLGGQSEDLSALAENGFFLEKLDRDAIIQSCGLYGD